MTQHCNTNSRHLGYSKCLINNSYRYLCCGGACLQVTWGRSKARGQAAQHPCFEGSMRTVPVSVMVMTILWSTLTCAQ